MAARLAVTVTWAAILANSAGPGNIGSDIEGGPARPGFSGTLADTNDACEQQRNRDRRGT
jgi:hypothetical protein